MVLVVPASAFWRLVKKSSLGKGCEGKAGAGQAINAA
jgi:hypothetical protein